VRIQKILFVACGLAALACPASTPPKPPGTPSSASQKPAEKVVWRESKSGLGFRLSNADPEKPDRPKLAKTTPLDAKERAAVLKRMPKFRAPAETKAVALREKSIPAPRPGETIKSEFPPRVSSAPPAVQAKASYEVTRHAPDGPVSVAPNLSISFSEPMVAVTSHLELAKEQVPVKLTPEPPGKWRWVGTQTLFFEPKGERFPAATDYQIEIVEGTKSSSGASLVKERKWSFQTPTLQIKDAFPENWGDPVDLLPVVFVELNQRIDKNALLASMAIRTGGKTLHDVRLATEDEILKDDDVRPLVEQAEPGRWIALKPMSELPKGASAEILIKKGAASAEGPRRTEADLAHSFRVRGSLALQTATCGWSDGCPPLAAWSVQFSNPIEDKSFDPKLVKVEPELAGMKIDVSSRYLTIRGRSKGRTKYTLTFAPEIKDTFGQNLDQPAKATIAVGEAEPMLFSEQDMMLVLDPAFDPKLSVYSVNRRELKVRLYAVEPKDWEAYLKFRQAWDWDGRLIDPPGRLVDTRVVKPKGERDELSETRIDLGPALKSGLGQVLAIVEPPTQPKPRNRWSYREREWVRAWVQVTKLGLTALRDPTDAYAWVTNLATGAPVADATVSVLGGGSGKTGADGTTRIGLGFSGQHLLAKQGGDLAFMPGHGGDTFSARSMTDSVRWFVFDDRKLYKPGERVHVKGWIRLAHAGKNGDLGRYSRRGADISWTVTDPRGAELAKGKVDTDDTDGFTFAFNLPKNANLGSAGIRLEADGGGYGRTYYHGFSIEEFRRPEFEVTAETSQGPHYVGKHALATVAATYYAGGGLSDAETNWEVQAEDAYFTPPNRSAYHFGKQRRWTWWSIADEKERVARETWKSKTDGEGRHRLRIDFDALTPAYPRQIDLQATVTDVNRQAWTARTNALVHPASVTVGIREESRVLKSGANAQLDVIVTDIEGAIVTGRPVAIKMSRIEATYRGRRRIETEEATQTCNVESATDAVRCSMPTSGGGLHRITAITKDAHGRPSQTQLEIWVMGSDPAENPTVGMDRVEIVPNKKEYRGGETAELLVVTPFAPAEGVLSVRRDGVVHFRRVRLEKRTQTLSVKLDPSWIPNLYVGMNLVGSRVREGETGELDPSLPKRPAAASGEASLMVPPKDRSLEIKITPEKKALSPGGSTRIGLDVKDANGRAVSNAAVALVVVDESVLALAGYELPDPLAVLYPSRGGGVEDYESRLRVALMHPDTARIQLKAKQKPVTGKEANGRAGLGLYGTGEGGGGMARNGGLKKASTRALESVSKPDAKPAASAAPAAPPPPPGKAEKKEESEDGRKAKNEEPIKVRSNFAALAAFIPRLTTDGKGHASASVKLPDSLTRYRVVAVAAEGEKRFGTGESDVTARLPLMVRPSLPRFLNFGDRLSLPVVLQNQTTKPVSVDVAVRASNLTLQNPSALRVEVPANDRVEVRFPAAAALAGTAKVQIGAISDIGNDASEVELPVWTPATTEAFATYGQIDQGAIAQPVKLPGNVYTQLGQLEVTTASTALQGLTDAVLYLVRYPFECNEQISSRILAIAALKDVLGAFKAPGLPPKAVLIGSVAADVEKLGQRQHWTGGWDWWRRDRTPDPFVSVHVAHALVRAKLKGFKVPKPMLDSAMNYLRAIRSHFPPWYGERSRRVVRAFSLSVRARNGENVAAEARELYKEGNGVTGLPMDAIGWLWPILSKDPAATNELAAIRKHVQNNIAETAGKAHFVTKVSDEAHVILESDRRTDGIVLEAMIDDQPENDVIPKVAQGLLAHRKRGRWYNTQDNVYVLLALDRYFNQYEKATPDFVARAWLGSRLAAEHGFKGRSVDRQHVDIPLTYLGAKPQNVTLAKDGTGRLYYRIGMEYVPKDLRPPPSEHGFSVSRLYEGADSPGDVRRDRDGTWRVKLGSRVRVRLAMVAQGRRYHVALVDPIPAGFEPMNPALATTGTIPRDPKAQSSSVPWWWASAWYEHQNMRDERVEAFTSLLYGGVYDYSYVTRATTPGDFVVPPPKAEEMYDPETFGRGPGDRVIIQ
jgi:uncharacterized protein YfaS (alpha-2-macroglobulin family)